MGKILHILTDDKFADYVIHQFEAPEMQSDFVLIPINGHLELVHEQNKTQILKYTTENIKMLVSRLGSYSAIVLHGLFGGFYETILRNVPVQVKVAWVFWGGEIYGRKDKRKDFLAPLTRFMAAIYAIKNGRISNWEMPLDLFKRIDYCLTGELEEYEYAKEYIGNPNMQHLWYTYYSKEDTIGSLINQHVLGENILFCNSAAIENNMFDAIIRLSLPWNRRKLKGKKFIMPLSYGGSWIKNTMLKLGGRLFGKQFVPLINFLPREEYNKMFLDCGTLILPYWCPAGQGNILTGLWLGMRVYLSEKSIAYNFFKRIGAQIFSFESDFRKYGCTPITEEEFQQNRAVLTKWYSKEHVMQAVRNVVEILSKK